VPYGSKLYAADGDIVEAREPNELLDTIVKMKRGEEVTIPLVAFKYIYKILNK
jgi:hypothetical protein